jgi:pimeloyl-ACP methyl ester carboxylesterase
MATAARRAGVAEETLIVAPRFASRNGACEDTLAAGEVNWPCDGNSWRAGGMSSDRAFSSFDFADELLRRLARKDRFPGLQTIVLAGHSAGGQFVTRYEMSNQVHDALGVPITYVVANPSSYAYPDAQRPSPVGGCRTYNMWPYGLEERSGYSAREPAAQLIRQLVSRPTTYLLGEKDVLRNSSFDASCAAMTQGATRLARGRAFASAVAERFGARHAVVTVPGCGHDPQCMFTANAALPVLFPKIR